MSPKPSACRDIERDLVSVAAGDATPAGTARVQAHLARCGACRQEFERYRAIDTAVVAFRDSGPAPEVLDAVRRRLDERLADLRARLVAYRVFRWPLGQVLLARSEQGVVLVEWVQDRDGLEAAIRRRLGGAELVEGGAEIEALYRELLEYVRGERTRFGWPLDLRAARSEFHRAVLRATAGVPYGAVTSYAQLARLVGQPGAVRAVAQALRWNPLPIVVPCHRIVGASGALVGYAGHRIDLKERLLALEGVRLDHAARQPRIARERMYVRDRDEAEYCVPSCGSLAGRSLAGLTLFASRQIAEAAGLRPCTTCRPDLHPLAS